MDTKLTKGEKLISGVCSGIANYIGIDPVVVRIIVAIFGWYLLIPYIIAALVMPEK